MMQHIMQLASAVRLILSKVSDVLRRVETSRFVIFANCQCQRFLLAIYQAKFTVVSLDDLRKQI